MTEATQCHCRSYALEAERKMGEMLLATERAQGAKGIGPIAVTGRNHNDNPTLASIGLSKRESAEAQRLASLPIKTFQEILAGDKTRKRRLAKFLDF